MKHRNCLSKMKVNNILFTIDMNISALKCLILESSLDEKQPEKAEKIINVLKETREYINLYY